VNTRKTKLAGVLIVEPKTYQDDRGYFLETFRARAYLEAGIGPAFVQDNQSGSHAGVLRGLHYQIKQPQGKLVRATAGVVFDVAVDLRRSSPTFGEWVGATLSAADHQQLWIPPGLAHGFYVLSEWAEIAYKVTNYYAPEWERTLRWDDPKVAIEWPLADGQPPTLSEKDEAGLLLDEAPQFD
jgi:dTDP-4-dehydrorhamnose 3,5-epimerase